MDVCGNGVVTFEEFATWWNAQKEAERRRIRRNVKEVFDSVDADDSGRLDKAEFAQVAKKAKSLLAIDPPGEQVTHLAFARGGEDLALATDGGLLQLLRVR